MKIAVAGVGYVGLSMAVLLSQHHPVTAVDVNPERVDRTGTESDCDAGWRGGVFGG